MQKIDKHFSDDIQNTVAKLLAKEDVTIQRSYKYKTAFFDIKKRLMGLPVFKELFPREVYDLFIGHEVGHALWTSMVDAERFDSIFHKPDLFNILEDIRIERMIQTEYPGLRPMFLKGYRTLWSRKFFGVQTLEEVNRFNFLDRLNIFAKLSIPVLFSDEEQPIVDEAMIVRDIDDIIEVAYKIVELTKNNKSKPVPSPKPDSSQSPESGDEDEYSGPPSSSEPTENETDGSNENNKSESETDDSESESDSDSDSDSETDDGTESESKKPEGDSGADDSESKNIEADDSANETTGNGDGEDNRGQATDDRDPLESLTQKSFGDALDDNIVDNPGYGSTTEYVAPSKEEIYRRVIGYKEVMAKRPDEVFNISMSEQARTIFEKYQTFIKDSKPAVAHLTNQFQQKKAAYQYSRATQSTRGVIDVNSLYKYKYDDNIFMSNTNLANAKSHGLVMMIDLSGSMSGGRIFGVIKQTLIMTAFCKKNSIPFNVYTWTDVHGDDPKYIGEDKKTAFDDKLSLASTTVHCVLSSDMPKATFSLASRQLYQIGAMGGYCRSYTYSYTPTFDSMGGTPICHTLLIASRLLCDLKKEWGVQVMNFMFLTDGEGYDLTKFSVRDDYASGTYVSDRNALFGTHTGKLNGHRVTFSGRDQYKTLIQHITEDLRVNTIGIFETHGFDSCAKYAADYVMSKLGSGYMERKENSRAVGSEFKKEGISFRENCGGYNKFILINSSVGEVEMESKYEDGDVKSIQRDFMKVGANKKAKRVFANQVIDTICSKF